MAGDKEAIELFRRYRPRTLAEVLGQDEAVKTLQRLLDKGKMPQCLLFIGASGVGKTTLARILKKELGCSNRDFEEVNCGIVEKAIETVREIQQRMSLSPMGGKCRIWLLDEIQSLSRAQFAQQALLKMLEDTPSHVYFMLATTDPGKLLPTIKTRCTVLNLKPLDGKLLKELLTNVCHAESKDIAKNVLQQIVDMSNGSARQALVLLHQVIGLDDEQDQLNALQPPEIQKQAFDIAKALVWGRTTWPDMAKILEKVDEDAEGIRHLVLACAVKEIAKGGKGAERAYAVICAFESNFFDSKRAGLYRACFEVLGNK